MWERVWAYIKEHRWAVGLAVYGLVIAVLILTINLWRTLLLMLLTGLGFLFGYLLDKGGLESVRVFLDRVFRKGSGK